MKKIDNLVIHFTKKPIRKDKKANKKTTKKSSVSFKKIAIALCFFGFLWFLESPFPDNLNHFWKASLVGYEPIEFTGTVSPVEKVPNWTALSDHERTLSYDQLSPSKLIPLPPYDINAMQKGLNYNGGIDDQRNIFVTYSVPYLGNYMLDGTENSGSHPGVDIKLPMNTPIRAIANGIVHKAEHSDFGNGNFVSIVHSGIPDPQNPSHKTTLLSTYAHLSTYTVKAGQKVKKGQIIGKSGKSGMTTAPHLHFQIDREGAPFFPYWPFSWNDVHNAGLNSYFDAVVRGIGKRNAQTYTIHPMNLISKFESYIPENLVVSSDPVSPQPDTTPDPDPQPQPEPTPVIPDPVPEVDSDPIEPETEAVTPIQPNTPIINQPTPERDRPVLVRIDDGDIVFEDIKTYVPNKRQNIRLLINENNLLASSGEIEISTTLRGLTDVEPPVLTQDDFKNGIAEIKFQSYSESAFKFVASGDFGEIKSKSLRAQIFSDISPTHQYADAIKDLKSRNIINGYGDGTFRPEGNINRAEAVKILLNGNNIKTDSSAPNVFPDVPSNTWFTDFVNTAAVRKIIKGYADGTFQPAHNISRAEFLKVALLTGGFEIPSNLRSDPYKDIPKEEWFAPYFEFSKTYNLLQSHNGYMDPARPITRGEAANIIYELSKLITL